MRVLVCGGRDFLDKTAVWKALHDVAAKAGHPIVVINGGAKGADEFARDWARDQWIVGPWSVDLITYRAQWLTHGPAAGPIRNQQMIDEGKPDLVIAFPGGRGTADMVRRAKAAGIRVIAPLAKETET